MADEKTIDLAFDENGDLAVVGGGTYCNTPEPVDLNMALVERMKAEVDKALAQNLAAAPYLTLDDLRLGGVPPPYAQDLDPYLPPMRTLRDRTKPARTRHEGSPDTRGLGAVELGPIRITITVVEVFGSFLRVVGKVPDRETGHMIPLEYNQNLTPGDQRPMRDIVREALKAFMFHEIEEQIYETIRGELVRVFDPHRAQSYTLTVKL